MLILAGLWLLLAACTPARSVDYYVQATLDAAQSHGNETRGNAAREAEATGTAYMLTAQAPTLTPIPTVTETPVPTWTPWPENTATATAEPSRTPEPSATREYPTPTVNVPTTVQVFPTVSGGVVIVRDEGTPWPLIVACIAGVLFLFLWFYTRQGKK